MFRKAALILAILSAACATQAVAEYKSKSKFDKNYKCTVHEAGGFSHTTSGHELVRFSEREEFFLTHISRLPITAVKGMFFDGVKLNNWNDDEYRENAESQFRKVQTHVSGYTEHGSYYIRLSDEDPRKPPSVFKECEAEVEIAGEYEKLLRISCPVRLHGKLEFDAKTRRFVHIYAGTWHTNLNPSYAGDSSFFEFGTCREHYE